MTLQKVDASDCPMLIQRILNDDQNQKLASVKHQTGRIHLKGVYQFGFHYYLKLVIENTSSQINITTEQPNMAILDYWAIQKDKNTECIIQIQSVNSLSEKFTLLVNDTPVNIRSKVLSKAIDI
ncbi:MAG: hypothetical protein ACRCS6_08685 [Turicibacter sp.]